jgi:hypothetical protein
VQQVLTRQFPFFIKSNSNGYIELNFTFGMKVPDCRIYFICLVIAVLMIRPVSADIITPTTTHVFFEKDGVPYNGTVQFTVNCYGHFDYPWIPRTTVIQQKATPEKEVIYSYSATCPKYGCAIYESYYLNYRAIDTCDLEGVAEDTSFIVKNFTRNPQPKNCTSLQQFDIAKGYDGYFRTTPEYKQCENASYAAIELCDTYTIPCGPVVDIQCGNRIVAGSLVNDTEKARTCREAADQNRSACDAYLEKVDPSTMILWNNTLTGQYEPAGRICTAHYTLPSGNTSSGQVFVPPLQVAHIEMKDTGSFWCWIVRVFGGRCE